jgi:hypothetical protein
VIRIIKGLTRLRITISTFEKLLEENGVGACHGGKIRTRLPVFCSHPYHISFDTEFGDE